MSATSVTAFLRERDLSMLVGLGAVTDPTDDEVLTDVQGAAFSGSDLHVMRVGAWVESRPATLGHEVFGSVRSATHRLWARLCRADACPQRASSPVNLNQAALVAAEVAWSEVASPGMTTAQRSCAASERSLSRRCGGSVSSTSKRCQLRHDWPCRGARCCTTRSPGTVSLSVTALTSASKARSGSPSGRPGKILRSVLSDHQEAYR